MPNAEQTHAQSWLRGAANAWSAVVVGTCLLAACATPAPAGDITCFEFGLLSLNDRSVVLRDVLDDFGLDSGSPINTQGIQRAVDRFCSTSTEPWGGAGRNLNKPIHGAVDWTAGDW